MNEKKDTSHFPLLEEANREAWKVSAYSRIDHPFETDLDRSVPTRPTTCGGLLEGVRQSLVTAERMLGHVIQRQGNAGRIVEAVCLKVRDEIKPFMANAVAGVLMADMQRAKSEHKHWKDYESYYASQAGTKPIREMNGSTFTPPWAGEELPLEEGAAF